MALKPEFQKQLDDAFQQTYPQIVEFAETHSYVSRIHTQKYEEFKKGFIAGLKASGKSEFEIAGLGMAGYMIRLDGETLTEAHDRHEGGLYDSLDSAKTDGNNNRLLGDYEIYSVTYKNIGDAPDFKLEYR